MRINLEENKKAFISKLHDIEVDQDIDIDALVAYLETTDFFIAPASVKYHLAIPGGLCEHSLNVLSTMEGLCAQFNLELPKASVIKVALLHELGKTNFYEMYNRNVKVDDQWTQVQEYRVVDASEREIFGDIAFNSYMIASKYIAFTEEEIIAVCNYSHVNDPGTHININDILDRSPLTLVLYLADMLSMYLLNK